MEKITNFSIVNELKTNSDILGFLEASLEEAKNDTDTAYIENALGIALKAYRKIGNRNLVVA
ncbi:MAG: hypothetical protein FWF51_11375 [Chitinivibrionia bacterium]|nr:hypothetical protein [Chitinivibrionia bacterium]